MLKQTPLNAAHRDQGAKLVEFAGWEMPLHYGSQVEEHHRVRRDAGMFDVSHMLAIDVQEAGARAFLRRLLANNVDKLKIPGKALYSCMLNEAGGVIDDLVVSFLAADCFRLVVNAGSADKDLAWLARQRPKGETSLTILPRHDLAMIAVQGPLARVRLSQALPQIAAHIDALGVFSFIQVNDYLVSRTGYTGEDGFEITLPGERAQALWSALAAVGVQPAGLGARDTLRLEAGMSLCGQDMDEKVNPLEAGLARTVDLTTQRDFIGRRALIEAKPTHAQRGLVLIDKGVLRARQQAQTTHGIGEVTSGGFAPTLGKSIALARLPLLTQVNDSAEICVRDRRLRARIVQPPFVRRGKILIEDQA